MGKVKAANERCQRKRCAAFVLREVNLRGRWVRAACRRYARAVRKLRVSAGWPNFSRIPPACDLDWDGVLGLVRWFSLDKLRFTSGSFLCSHQEPIQLDHPMSRSGIEMVRYADDMFMLCRDAQKAQTTLQTLREWAAQAGLELHPHLQKTKIVDIGQPKAHFSDWRAGCGKPASPVRREGRRS